MRECDEYALVELYKVFAEAPITLGWGPTVTVEDAGRALKRWALTAGPAMLLIDAVRHEDDATEVFALSYALKEAVAKARGG